MVKIIQILLSTLLFCSEVVFSNEIRQINVPAGDSANDYYREVLHLALIHGANGRPVPHLNSIPFMQQERVLSQLQLGETVDVTWAGPNPLWVNKLRMVKVPLDRGLLGYRQFIIHSEKINDFNKVHFLADLKRFTACQGIGWPDTRIMRNAGLQVQEISDFEGIYKMVAGERCDYFPRGYIEAITEIEKRSTQYPQLMIYKPLILYYPYSMFFYLNTNDEDLAQWIETGLEKMIDNGTLMATLKSHTMTKNAFPLHKTSLRFIELHNSLLPKEINTKNIRYWFQRTDFETK